MYYMYNELVITMATFDAITHNHICVLASEIILTSSTSSTPPSLAKRSSPLKDKILNELGPSVV